MARYAVNLIRSQVSGWHALETRGTSVEGRGSEVEYGVDNTLFTNVPKTCHSFLSETWYSRISMEDLSVDELEIFVRKFAQWDLDLFPVVDAFENDFGIGRMD